MIFYKIKVYYKKVIQKIIKEVAKNKKFFKLKARI